MNIVLALSQRRGLFQRCEIELTSFLNKLCAVFFLQIIVILLAPQKIIAHPVEASTSRAVREHGLGGVAPENENGMYFKNEKKIL